MKKIFTFSSLLVILISASAQCPQSLRFDTTVCSGSISKIIDASVLKSRLCGDSILITFNAVGTPLAGDTNVYFHSGPEFRPFTGWQGAYTVGTWGTNNGVGRMTMLAANTWGIRIHARTYYNYAVDSCLNGIFCVFRNFDGTKIAKNGTNDIYLWCNNGQANPTSTYPNIAALNTSNTAITYLWNDGNTNVLRTFTSTGNYSVTATGIGGCTATGTVNIRSAAKPAINLGPDTIRCNNNMVTITAPIGYAEYRWFGGSPSSNTYNAFGEASYWLNAIDSNGCQSSDTLRVWNNHAAYLQVGDTSLPCGGVGVGLDASVNINAHGDSITIIYDATQGVSGLVGAQKVYFHSGAEMVPFGGYQYPRGNWGQDDGVGKMDSLGNNKWRITIHPQSYYGYPIGQNPNGILCVFRNANGSQTGKNASNQDIFILLNPFPTCQSQFSGVVATRKARPVNYQWSTGATTAAITVSSPGTYRVTASQGSCATTDTIVVSAAGTINFTLGNDTTLCAGAKDTLRAGNFARYIWSTGDTLSRIVVSSAGTYSVTVTAANGCTASDSKVYNYSNRQLNLGMDVNLCNTAGNYSLSANTGFVSYQLFDHAPQTLNTFSITPKQGLYWANATDSFGCKSYDTVQIRISDVAALNLPDTVRTCPGGSSFQNASTFIERFGDSVVIIYDAAAATGVSQLVGATKVYFHSGPEFRPFSGWQGAYTVGNWGQDDGVGQMTSLGNNKWRIALVPEMYYRYHPDSSLNGLFFLFRNETGTLTGKDNGGADFFLNLSNGQSTPSNGAAISAMRKSSGNITYLWSNGRTTDTTTLTVPGTYRVTATDGVCQRTDSVVFTFSSVGAISLGKDTTLCAGQSVVLNAGGGYTSYMWSSGDTTRTITVSNAGIYSVTAMNSGCAYTGSIKVLVSGTRVNLGPDITKCSSTFSQILTAPNGFTQYRWFTNTNTQTITATKPGCYWIRAIDSAGCVSYDTMLVKVAASAYLSLSDSVKGCNGKQDTLDAMANIAPNGDMLQIDFDATGTALAGVSKVYFHSAPELFPFGGWAQNHTVGNWGQDNGVGQMTSLGNNKWRITIMPLCYYALIPDSNPAGIFCVFRNADGSADVKNGTNDIYINLQGPVVSASVSSVTAKRVWSSTPTFAWSTGATNSSIIVNSTNNYIVTVTDGICSKSDTVIANYSVSPTVNIGNDTCFSGTTVLNAGSGFSAYVWSTGASTAFLNVSSPGKYSVTVTNSAGCNGSDTITLSSPPVVNLGRDTCVATGGSITLNAGHSGASYLWSTGATTPSINVTTPNTYNVVVTTTAGCKGMDTIVVAACPVSNCNFKASFSVLSVSPNNQITLKDASTNTSQVKYLWQFGDGNTSTDSGNVVHTYAQGGTYTIRLILSKPGCPNDTFTLVRNVNSLEHIAGVSSFSLYPIPANENLQVLISSSQKTEVRMSLVNSYGALVWQKIATLHIGENQHHIALHEVAPGLYYLQVETLDNNEKITRRVIVK